MYYLTSPVRIWREQSSDYPFLGKLGRLVSWTKVVAAPVSFSGQAPYMVGLIDCGEWGKKMGQLIGVEEGDLKIGQKFIGVWRRLRVHGDEGLIEYGVKFRALPGGRGKNTAV